jgi:hypothetical protein
MIHMSQWLFEKQLCLIRTSLLRPYFWFCSFKTFSSWECILTYTYIFLETDVLSYTGEKSLFVLYILFCWFLHHKCLENMSGLKFFSLEQHNSNNSAAIMLKFPGINHYALGKLLFQSLPWAANEIIQSVQTGDMWTLGTGRQNRLYLRQCIFA